MAKLTQDEKIAKLKSWCEANYTNGADTMVECWDAKDYADSLARHDGSYRETLATLKAVASVYLDRQANARNERF